jgi:AcrR family transcriptional regulator
VSDNVISSRTATRPLRRDAAINRERIFLAARELFAEEGLDASLSDIAERANVGLGTIYRNFKDKEDLIASLVDEKYTFVGTIVAEVEGFATGWASFCALVERLIDSFVADRALEEIMLSEYGHRFASRALEQLAPGATRIMERAKHEHSLRDDIEFSDLPIILAMLVGSVDVTAPVDPRIWRRYLQLLLAGLAAHVEYRRFDTAPLTNAQLERLSGEPPTRRFERPRTRRVTGV